MLGYLLPCSGGPSIPLARPQAFLGRRPGSDRQAPLSAQTALCQLRFEERWWQIENLVGDDNLRVNGEIFKTRRLRRQDEIAIGRARYRIDYQSPDAAAELDRIAESVLFGESSPGKISRSAQPVPSPVRNGTDAGSSRENALRKVPEVSARPGGTSSPRFPAPLKRTSSSAALSQLGRLVPLGGGKDIPLLKPKILIGRSHDNDIALRVKTVSSSHCMLELIDGYWRVTDLGSRNGVRVNSVPCQQEWVFPESRLTVGDQRFNLEYLPQGDPPLTPPSSQQSLLSKVGMAGDRLEEFLATQPEETDEFKSKKWTLRDDD